MQNLKHEPATVANDDVAVLTERELKRLVQLLNVLMEVDFCISRKPKETTDD